MDYSFLKSNRFWALIAFATLTGLVSIGYVSADVANPILITLAGYTGIRTIDRFGEKSGSTDTK